MKTSELRHSALTREEHTLLRTLYRTWMWTTMYSHSRETTSRGFTEEMLTYLLGYMHAQMCWEGEKRFTYFQYMPINKMHWLLDSHKRMQPQGRKQD